MADSVARKRYENQWIQHLGLLELSEFSSGTFIIRLVNVVKKFKLLMQGRGIAIVCCDKSREKWEGE